VQRSARKHRHVELDPTLLPPIDDPGGHDGGVALREGLASALAALPPEHRAVVLMIDADGFDYAAASAVLGVPVGTVASRLSRARAALRRELGGRR